MITILSSVAYYYLWGMALFCLFLLCIFLYFISEEWNKPPDKIARHFQRQREAQKEHNKKLEAYQLNKQKAELKEWENKEGVLSTPLMIVLFVILFLFGWGLSYV